MFPKCVLGRFVLLQVVASALVIVMCFLNVALSVCGAERVVSSAIDDGSLHVPLNMCGGARGCLCVLRLSCVP